MLFLAKNVTFGKSYKNVTFVSQKREGLLQKREGLLQKREGLGAGITKTYPLKTSFNENVRSPYVSKNLFVVHKDIEKAVFLVVEVRGPHDEVVRVHVLEEVHSARVVNHHENVHIPSSTHIPGHTMYKSDPDVPILVFACLLCIKKVLQSLKLHIRRSTCLCGPHRFILTARAGARQSAC